LENNQQKLYEVLRWASLFLEQKNREPKVAEILLMHHLNMSRTEFLGRMRETIPAEVLAAFKEDVWRHAETGVPVQHLIGTEFFYGREFLVNEHVLIPRPETEELVLHVIDEIKRNGLEQPVLVDIGTGSGVIAVTLALEVEEASVYATELSVQALEVAEKNAERLGACITFLQGDFLKPLQKEQVSPNVLVSNPPYISEKDEETLSDTVKGFDPPLALFADEDGLAAYKQILAEAGQFPELKLLAFEIGYDQGEAVRQLVLQAFPESDVRVLKDINGKDRIVSVCL
jgi:release factor glutamine methyltransferase